jgi:AcrR family transcriptional regulator
LLQVAREVFLELGVRATVLEVAQRASVSEGSVFHHFKSKEALFQAAMQLPADEVPTLLMGAVSELEGLPIEEALARLATALLDIGKVAIPLMMMSWSNPGCAPNKNHVKYREFLKKLASYFESQMATGTLRQMDSEVVARAFLGSIHHYCMTRVLAGPDATWVIAESLYCRGLVDLLLRGALAAPGASPRARS